MHDALPLDPSRPAWHLAGAQSLRVRGTGRLRVMQGRVWLTVDGEAQDRVLAAGDSLTLRRGHRLVVEAWSAHEGARLRWDAERAAGYARTDAPAAQHSSATVLSCVRSGSQAASPR